MKVALVVSSLGPGGAERVLSTMANYWAERGWEVTVITLADQESDFYVLHPLVKRVGLGLMSNSAGVFAALASNLKRIKLLRATLKNTAPDAVISFIEKVNILTLLATRGLGLRVVVAERTDPSCYQIGPDWSRLRCFSYPWAHAVVGQSSTVTKWLEQFVNREKLHVVPNPVPRLSTEKGASLCLREFLGGLYPTTQIIAAMGRLGEEKGFDLLIRAFARCVPSSSEWHLVVMGEGNQREHLGRLAEQLGVGDRVHMPGRVANPIPFLSQAQLFVLSSRFEGFPNALCEAMACGLPVISFDCPSGPREIIRHGIDGVLVSPESIEALAETMQGLMADPERRARLASRAIEVVERFSVDRVMQRWEMILRETQEERQ